MIKPIPLCRENKIPVYQKFYFKTFYFFKSSILKCTLLVAIFNNCISFKHKLREQTSVLMRMPYLNCLLLYFPIFHITHYLLQLLVQHSFVLYEVWKSFWSTINFSDKLILTYILHPPIIVCIKWNQLPSHRRCHL